MNDVFIRTPPSSSRRVWENGGSCHSKREDLKHVSSALEDKVGSSGVIRRVRQQPNISSHGYFGNGVAYHENHASSSSLQELLLLNGANNDNTPKAVKENRDDIHYPPMSCVTGTNIAAS